MKKLVKELQELIDKHGYWSKEVLEFNTKIPYDKMCKVNNLVNKK